MKKLTALLLCLCLLALPLLSGCGEDEDASGDNLAQGSSPAGVEWIDKLIAEAEIPYSWFDGCGKPATDSGDIRTVGDIEYVRVIEPGAYSPAELRATLEALFTQDIVEALLITEAAKSYPMFREYDGMIYMFRGAVGEVPRDIGERTGSLVSQDEREIVYHLALTYKYYNSTYSAEYDYKLTLGEDGVWRFSRFRLPAMLLAEQMFTYEQPEE